jgi:hypothetical protein
MEVFWEKQPPDGTYTGVPWETRTRQHHTNTALASIFSTRECRKGG